MNNRSFNREANGPELDNKLIRLVRENPAIYDVNHPHYRRNPVRIAIWERIASELNSTSRFLQTKWKNIRYNYLQELKCLETGHMNANVRKRRFTEDLSFLQNVAQIYKVKQGSFKNCNSYNSSDTESNSYMYPDTNTRQCAQDVIEIDHSNDSFENQNKFEPPSKKFNCDKVEMEDQEDDDPTPLSMVQGQHALRAKPINQMVNGERSPINFYNSDDERSSPLLTPLVVMDDEDKQMQNGKSRLGHNRHQENNYDSTLSRKSQSAAYTNDPLELYCLSLVDSLRNMPRSERERVKYEFAKILKDANYIDQK